MKFLFDFFPVILFFITFKSYDDPMQGILAATAVAIIAGIIQVVASWMKNRRIEKTHIYTLLILVVLGGLTLVFKDPLFIKWKPTAVNWLFAIVLFASHFIGHKPLVRRMMDHSIQLPDHVWHKLSFSWVVFFIVMGFANLYVAFNYDLDTWVDFKFYGILGLTLLFVVLQAIYLSRHIIETETEETTTDQQKSVEE